MSIWAGIAIVTDVQLICHQVMIEPTKVKNDQVKYHYC